MLSLYDQEIRAVGLDLNGTLAMKGKDHYVAVPGGLEFVQALARTGQIKLALVTDSSPHMIETILGGIGLNRELFNLVVSGNDLRQRKKPDPYSWQEASRLLGVPAEYFLAVENAPNGVMAAREAGHPVVAILTDHREARLWLAGTTLVVANFGQLAELLGLEL